MEPRTPASGGETSQLPFDSPFVLAPLLVPLRPKALYLS